MFAQVDSGARHDEKFEGWEGEIVEGRLEDTVVEWSVPLLVIDVQLGTTLYEEIHHRVSPLTTYNRYVRSVPY